MKNTFFCPLPSVRRFAAVATLCVALCCPSFFSCSANDDSGSLSIVMPGSSPSRSITSENPSGMGLPAEADVDGCVFSVYIRDANNDEVEKYTGVRPGATLTIDQLRAGTYNIAIRCISLLSETVGFYGAAQADVKGGTENTVGITLKFITSVQRRIIFTGVGCEHYTLQDGKITCKNGDFYSFGSSFSMPSLDTLPSGDIVYYFDLSGYFFEPGFTYSLELSISENGDPPFKRKAFATATRGGIYFYVD
jgi:hypothetical protein